VAVAGGGHQPEDREHLAGERLEVAPVAGQPALAQQRVEVLAGGPVADVHDPREMVDARRFDVQVLEPGARHRDEVGQVVGVGVDVEALRDRDAVAVGEDRGGHRVAPQKLVAQAEHLDLRVAMHAERQADQRVDQIDVPRVGAQALHVARDVENQRQVAAGVRQRARPAVLGVGLADAVPQRDLPVHLPDGLALADLHRDDHEVGAGQDIGAAAGAGDRHARVPGEVHFLGQPGHGLERGLVDVHQGELGAAQPFGPDERRHGAQPEYRAARAEDDDFRRCGGGHGV